MLIFKDIRDLLVGDQFQVTNRAPCLLRVVPTGCRMFSSVKAFEGQQYSTLKRQCLASGLLFEDLRFPAVDDTLFYQGNRIGRVHWKRPRVSELLLLLLLLLLPLP